MTPRRAITTHADTLLAGLVGGLYLVEIFSEGRFAGDRVLSVPVALLFAATLAGRRSAPLLGLLAGVGVIVLSNNLVPALADTPAFLLGFALAVYSTGRYAGGRSALAGGLAVVASLPLAVIEPGEPFSASDSAFIAIFILGPWVAGRVIRHRSERERDLEGRAVALEHERDAKAREAVVEERARIARELHDVVAHAISVIVLQARGGRRMLAEDPEDTRRALDAIEHAGEQAPAEMRRLLEVLRRADEELALAPRPSLSRIDQLVAELTATGLPVDVTVEGEEFALSPGVDVTAYRIVQEGLTNALKHAGPARAHVILRYSPGELELEIVDDGAGGGNGGGSGHGLAGIRERVAVYGGELESGIEVVGEAGDGREAIARAGSFAPDVVLMDIRMPGVDGIEATRSITAREHAPRVLVLTTFDGDEYVYKALRAGASAFLLKDAPEHQLLAAIRVVADGGSLFAPSVTRRVIEQFARRAGGSAAPPALEELTARELDVLRLVARGLSNAEIAAALVVTEHTTKTHVASILQKLHLRNRVQAVVLAYESGLVRPGD